MPAGDRFRLLFNRTPTHAHAHTRTRAHDPHAQRAIPCRQRVAVPSSLCARTHTRSCARTRAHAHAHAQTHAGRLTSSRRTFIGPTVRTLCVRGMCLRVSACVCARAYAGRSGQACSRARCLYGIIRTIVPDTASLHRREATVARARGCVRVCLWVWVWVWVCVAVAVAVAVCVQ